MADEKTKTIIFMSADVAGSTIYKQTAYVHDDDISWLPAFEAFFREFPLVLTGEIGLAFEDLDYIPNIRVWKIIGDEIVFKTQPNNTEEALRLTEAFYRATVKYDTHFFERWSLRVRGTCWACDFPGRNIELEIPEMENDMGAYVDYLGPDVDTGFRISNYGESGNVIICMNLAEALAKLSDNRGIRFHYTGTAVLKGVFGGRPYPLILITFEDTMPDLWRWEVEESAQLKSLRDQPPMEPQELSDLIGKIRTYLNRMCRLGLKKLDL